MQQNKVCLESVQWFDDPLMPTPYCINNGKALCLKNFKELTKKLEKSKKKHNREEYGIKGDDIQCYT